MDKEVSGAGMGDTEYRYPDNSGKKEIYVYRFLTEEELAEHTNKIWKEVLRKNDKAP